MSIKNIEMQDNSGNIYYPHTNSDIVKYGGSTVGATLSDLTNKVNNIKIADGSTEQKGIVKLNNTVASTSIVEAATANAVKTAYDKGNDALNKANQAFQYANNGKTNIANVIGYVTGNNTHQEIANEIQNDKNILANNLNSKGVGANGNSPLRELANIVGNISIASLGGATVASGTSAVFLASDGYACVDLSICRFIPDILILVPEYFNYYTQRTWNSINKTLNQYTMYIDVQGIIVTVYPAGPNRYGYTVHPNFGIKTDLSNIAQIRVSDVGGMRSSESPTGVWNWYAVKCK